MRQILKVSSCMAPIMEPFALGVTQWLQGRLSRPVEFVGLPQWQEREAAFDEGRIDLLWICGLPYVWKADSPQVSVRLSAAPVMAGERYGGRPVYFSDVVVHKASAANSFEDLAGRVWSINEPGSHSGYNIVRDYLARRDLDWGFFGRVIEAGSHENSLRGILQGEIDASAIDSTVLEAAIDIDPQIAAEIRVLATLGPSPIPPWIARGDMAAEAVAAITYALARMHESESGKAILGHGRIARFVPVQDEQYNPIREMDARGRRVGSPRGIVDPSAHGRGGPGG